MARKNTTKKKIVKASKKKRASVEKKFSLKDISYEPKNRYVAGIMYLLFALFIGMSAASYAGTIGDFVHETIMWNLVGYGFLAIIVLCLVFSYRGFKKIDTSLKDRFAFLGMFLGVLGIVDILGSAPELDASGVIGKFIGSNLVAGFDVYFSLILLFGLIGILSFIVFDPKLSSLKKVKEDIEDRLEERAARQEETDRIEEEVSKALESSSREEEHHVEPIQEPKEDTKKSKKKKKKSSDDDDITIDSQAVFASSYQVPPLSLLGKSSGKPSTGDIKANANLIKRTLSNFGIEVEMDEISIGPTVTRYAMKPAQGVRLSKIASLQNELALALAAKSIRIEAPIPGRSLVGIEVPNSKKSTIGLGSLLAEDTFNDPGKPLLVSLGKGVSGKSHFANIGKMPHALIAGATGAGKSVTIHNIIMSLLYKNGPDMLRFIMIDPKRVEMTLYKKIPHLLTPVITDPKKAVLSLKWAVKEMERRYDVLQKQAVRDISSYHSSIVGPAYSGLSPEEIEEQSGELPEKMPYIVVIIDELSDIMSSYPRELEASIVRLAQMSRAVGIHLMLATQRPDVNVITGLIKANVPTRLALKVTSQIDSRTILDKKGAEKLLGYGDMLYKGEGSNEPVRIQCPYVSEAEVKSVVDFIKKNYKYELEDTISISDDGVEDGTGGVTLASDDDEDPMVEEAIAVVVQSQKASTSYLQRRLAIGYNRAARIIDILHERGIIGPQNGSKPREVYQKAEAAAADPEDIDTDGTVEV